MNVHVTIKDKETTSIDRIDIFEIRNYIKSIPTYKIKKMIYMLEYSKQLQNVLESFYNDEFYTLIEDGDNKYYKLNVLPNGIRRVKTFRKKQEYYNKFKVTTTKIKKDLSKLLGSNDISFEMFIEPQGQESRFQTIHIMMEDLTIPPNHSFKRAYCIVDFDILDFTFEISTINAKRLSLIYDIIRRVFHRHTYQTHRYRIRRMIHENNSQRRPRKSA